MLLHAIAGCSESKDRSEIRILSWTVTMFAPWQDFEPDDSSHNLKA